MKKIIYVLLVNLCLFACTKTEIENVVREVELEKPSAVYYYYSYKSGEVIGAEKLGYSAGTFTPGCTFVHGDTLFIANTQAKHYSVDLYSLSTHKKIHSLNKWTYKGAEQMFISYVDAISVSNGRLYLGNRESCIDVFDLKTLAFITRVGNGNWGEGKTQLFHVHAMAIVGDYMVVRTKKRLQVMLQSEVNAESYQNISFYARSSTQGFDVNNGFNSHQMTVDSLGTIFLADYGQDGNRKIQVIDTCLIKKADDLVMTNDQTMNLDFYPRGIALYKDLMYISASDGSIRIYDRSKKKFLLTCKSVVGYTFKGAQKLFVNGNRLWVTDVLTKEVVGVDIFQSSIEEYE